MKNASFLTMVFPILGIFTFVGSLFLHLFVSSESAENFSAAMLGAAADILPTVIIVAWVAGELRGEIAVLRKEIRILKGESEEKPEVSESTK